MYFYGLCGTRLHPLTHALVLPPERPALISYKDSFIGQAGGSSLAKICIDSLLAYHMATLHQQQLAMCSRSYSGVNPDNLN